MTQKDMGAGAMKPRASVVGSRKPHQRAAIRAHATRLFERQGFHATTMDDIAAAADLNKATVYHYYSSKKELLFDICSSGIDAILTRFERHPSSGNAPALISRIVSDVVEAMAEDRSRTAVYYQERPFIESLLDTQHYSELRVKEASYARHVRDVIETGVRAGELQEADPRIAAMTLLSAAGQTYQWYRPTGPLSASDIADAMASIFLRGLAR